MNKREHKKYQERVLVKFALAICLAICAVILAAIFSLTLLWLFYPGGTFAWFVAMSTTIIITTITLISIGLLFTKLRSFAEGIRFTIMNYEMPKKIPAPKNNLNNKD